MINFLENRTPSPRHHHLPLPDPPPLRHCLPKVQPVAQPVQPGIEFRLPACQNHIEHPLPHHVVQPQPPLPPQRRGQCQPHLPAGRVRPKAHFNRRRQHGLRRRDQLYGAVADIVGAAEAVVGKVGLRESVEGGQAHPVLHEAAGDARPVGVVDDVHGGHPVGGDHVDPAVGRELHGEVEGLPALHRLPVVVADERPARLHVGGLRVELMQLPLGTDVEVAGVRGKSDPARPKRVPDEELPEVGEQPGAVVEVVQAGLVAVAVVGVHGAVGGEDGLTAAQPVRMNGGTERLGGDTFYTPGSEQHPEIEVGVGLGHHQPPVLPVGMLDGRKEAAVQGVPEGHCIFFGDLAQASVPRHIDNGISELMDFDPRRGFYQWEMEQIKNLVAPRQGQNHCPLVHRVFAVVATTDIPPLIVVDAGAAGHDLVLGVFDVAAVGVKEEVAVCVADTGIGGLEVHVDTVFPENI